MQRLALAQGLALAVTATMLCCGSAARAQVYPEAVTVCQPIPAWYPRLVVVSWGRALRRRSFSEKL